jgi:CDP-diacylglycerol--glycerol-3-phosphate 3-phosphatidyltransferase
MTTANKITILRILLVPFFVVELIYYHNSGDEGHRLLALAAFGVGALSDAVDGYIARRYNQRSELGSLLDPLADKMLLVSAWIVLSLSSEQLGRVPLWLVATVLSRDVMLVLGLGVIYYAAGKVVVRPRWVSKVATVLQMACILWLLLKLPRGWFPTLAFWTAFCTGLSGVLYVYDGVRQLSATPASAANTSR